MNVIRFLHRKTDRAFLYDYKTLHQALRYMRSHGYTELPVVDRDGFYLGAVNEGDFLWHLIDYGGCEKVKDDPVSALVRHNNIPALKITASDAELEEAARRCSFVPIVDDRDAFIGVLERDDIMEYFAQKALKASSAAGEEKK